jgi:hypothetical protein
MGHAVKTKDAGLKQEQKVMLAIFLAILLLLCIAGTIYVINLSRRRPAAVPLLFSTPTTASVSLYLPLTSREIPPVEGKPGPAAGALPTESPAESPSAIPANQWKLIEDDPLSYNLRGYWYDLGVFENLSTGDKIKAFCADPGWPSPNLGDLFLRNDYNVLIPIDNDQPPLKQHFIIIGN